MKISKIKLSRNKIILTVIDIIIVILSCFLALFLTSNRIAFSTEDIIIIRNSTILYIIVYQIFFRIFDVYSNITRYENGKDYLIYMVSCILSCILLLVLRQFSKLQILNTKECILAAIFIEVASISYRVIIRIILNDNKPKKEKDNEKEKEIKNLLIIGAGDAAREIIKAVKGNLKDDYNIVGLIDDNPNKLYYSISGVKILGNRYQIAKVCEKYDVNEIFFSIVNISIKDKKEILQLCQESNAKIRMLPSTTDIIKNKDLLKSLKDVDIADLLGREEVILDNNNIENLIKNKVILVTGGGGSIGSELCRQIATYNPKTLLILDIYENNLYNIEIELKSKYPNLDIQAIVGSVRDKNKLNDLFATYKPYLVFHAAAHKHVPLMEVSPLEAIKNNVLGTKNVVDCADKYGTNKFILISTDKAVNPTSIMGATKRMCEMIIQAKSKESNTEYAAVRFGNVLGSNGSVIPLFKEQIKNGGPVTVTHKEITRFFMTIPEASGLVLQAMTYAKGGEIFVLDMGEPVKIYDLAVSLIKLSGLQPDKDIPIEITGLRPGEKLYEELLMSEEGLTHTAHNKIFISEPLEMSSEEVENRVTLLRNFVKTEEHSMSEIKSVMKKAVPTYDEPINRNKTVKNYRKELDRLEKNRKDNEKIELKEA